MTAPTTRTTSFEDALDHIAAEETLWVRLAAVRDDGGGWRARLMDVTGGEAPPSWDDAAWEYPDALFNAGVLSGPAVASSLRSGNIQVGDNEITLPQMMTIMTWERRQSRSPAPFETLNWPVTETSLSLNDGTSSEPQGHMVAKGAAPSFLSFYAAAASYFWFDGQPIGGSLYQGIVYRQQDIRGRINAVRISHDSVGVDIDGTDLDQMIVELPGNTPGPSERIAGCYDKEPQTVCFPIKDGLQTGSWVLLRNGSEWIDRRFLSVPYARGNEAGVEIVVDAGTRLEALVSTRERQQLEFKQQLPKENEDKSKVMKTVCAFANDQGGSILVGVDDDRNVIGLGEPTVGRLTDQITQMVRSWVEPRPNITFQALPIADSDKVVLEMWVEPGDSLYGSGRPGETRTVYVRHHGVTEKATPAEIAAIVQARMPRATPGSIFT